MGDAMKEIGSCVLSIVFASIFFYRTGKYKAIRLLINDLLTSHKCPLCGRHADIEWLKPTMEQRVKRVVFGDIED